MFVSASLTLVKSGMTEAKISVEYNPGQFLYVMTNFEMFKRFKFSKTGSGNQHEVEVNGKKPPTGSEWIEPKITWERRLPESPKETEAFFLKNNTQIHVAGFKRNLNLSLN